MRKDFYYAELNLTVTLVDGQPSILKTLSDNESLALQNMLWLTITNFLTTRALYLMESVDVSKKTDEKPAFKPDENEGGKHNDEHCSI